MNKPFGKNCTDRNKIVMFGACKAAEVERTESVLEI